MLQRDLRDAMRDRVDELSAAKRLEGETSQHTGAAQTPIIDDLSHIRHTLGTVDDASAPIEHPAATAWRA